MRNRDSERLEEGYPQNYVNINTERQFHALVGNRHSMPVVVAFTSVHCGHCERMLPQYMAAALHDRRALYLNVDTSLNSQTRALHRLFNIQGVPTIIKFSPRSTTSNSSSNDSFVRYTGDRSTESFIEFADSS
jgi:thioredoxin-like negative regulator of GroEL